MIGFKRANNVRGKLQREFYSDLHPACRAVIVEGARYFGMEWVITEVLRDYLTMVEYYGITWKEDGKWSWHLAARAVDIRVKDWPPGLADEVTAWLKLNWPHLEIVLHDVGQGFHLHIAAPSPWSMLKRLRRWRTVRRERAAGRLTTPPTPRKEK